MTIAGSDSGGGAGIQADLKTFAAHGVFGTSVVTAVTAQNTAEVRGVHVVDPSFVELQIDTVLSDLPVASVKTGMLASSATVAAVARWAAAGAAPQSRRRSRSSWPRRVAPCSTRTRSTPTAASCSPTPSWSRPTSARPRCSPTRRSTDVDDMVRAARRLADTGVRAVMVKGGHLSGDARPRCRGLDGTVHVLDGPRVTSPNDHGTGCTLSAATAALLALRRGA